jgi:septal ring factor EnvC (AmiA/AmiB activator)
MRRFRNYGILLLAVIVLASFAFSGCTRYAKEEQLMTLDETKASAASAEAKVAELEQKKAELEKKLDEKKQELDGVLKEKAKIQDML